MASAWTVCPAEARARRWHLVACVGEIKRVIVESSLPGQKRLVAQDVLLIGPWWAS